MLITFSVSTRKSAISLAGFVLLLRFFNTSFLTLRQYRAGHNNFVAEMCVTIDFRGSSP